MAELKDNISGTKRSRNDDINDESKEPQLKKIRLDNNDDNKALISSENISYMCPYLDQINRKTLDFDFEKICSVSMSNHNVYGCLVCGSYYQGRSNGTPAYFHSLQTNHRIFIHLNNGKIYCLPDNYEIIDPSLNDIKHNLFPEFTEQDISNLDTRVEYSHALNERDYLPGVIGLNNLNNTDWLNVIIQSLMRVKLLRNYFLRFNSNNKCSLIVKRFSELVKKYFNFKNFKGQVSPHELLQAISITSNKKYQIGNKADPLTFLSWFLNILHNDLKDNKNKSIISKIFKGNIQVNTINNNDNDSNNEANKSEIKPFFYLLLKLPDMPLFKDSQTEKFIPQIPLNELLNRFNGETLVSNDKDINIKHTYLLKKLPPYIIIAFKRFHENNFYIEKNITIVNFVLKNLDLKPYFSPMQTDKNVLKTYSIKKLKNILKKLNKNIDINTFKDKNNIISEIIKSGHFDFKTKYDLIANICHDGNDYFGGNYKSCVYDDATNYWYEIQDLHVSETMPQLVAVSQAFIQIWRKR